MPSPAPPPEVVLINGHMDRFTLSEPRGYGALMFFSSLSCAQPCTDVLARFVQVKAALGEYAPRVRFVMVGVDAEHDTPISLLRHVRAYDPDFMALTGDLDAVVPFARKHGVTVRRVVGKVGTHHIPLVPYLIYLDPSGRWTMSFLLDVPPDVIADEIIQSLSF